MNKRKWRNYTIVCLAWLIVLIYGCASNVNINNGENIPEYKPIISKTMKSFLPKDRGYECNIYIDWRLSLTYKIEINLFFLIDRETSHIEYVDLNPPFILWENNNIIAVNQIPENMDEDRKIIQIIDVESNDENESVKLNFDVEIVDNNSKILSKQGSILLQMNNKKMVFTIKEYSLH
ncbi:MAG: hypothetical protein HDR44_01525 [Allobaculum sp.]|nr:hypothetical protein [Allobaculum sp.]